MLFLLKTLYLTNYFIIYEMTVEENVKSTSVPT